MLHDYTVDDFAPSGITRLGVGGRDDQTLAAAPHEGDGQRQHTLAQGRFGAQPKRCDHRYPSGHGVSSAASSNPRRTSSASSAAAVV